MARRLAIEIFVVLVVGLVLGIFGPFGTYSTPTAPRIAYWMVFGLAGYAVFRPLIIVGEWVSTALSISRWIGIAIALVIAALPMTLIIATVRFRFDVSEALRWDGLGQLYFQVWLIGFIINGLTLMVFGQPRSAPSSQPDHKEAAAPPTEIAVEPALREQPLIDRLPAGFERIHALGSEDHYVRVYSDDRDTLILMRLRDAIMAMGSVEGM